MGMQKNEVVSNGEEKSDYVIQDPFTSFDGFQCSNEEKNNIFVTCCLVFQNTYLGYINLSLDSSTRNNSSVKKLKIVQEENQDKLNEDFNGSSIKSNSKCSKYTDIFDWIVDESKFSDK
jgi:hypothetical protein